MEKELAKSSVLEWVVKQAVLSSSGSSRVDLDVVKIIYRCPVFKGDRREMMLFMAFLHICPT